MNLQDSLELIRADKVRELTMSCKCSFRKVERRDEWIVTPGGHVTYGPGPTIFTDLEAAVSMFKNYVAPGATIKTITFGAW